jgi:hypothetical protein
MDPFEDVLRRGRVSAGIDIQHTEVPAPLRSSFYWLRMPEERVTILFRGFFTLLPNNQSLSAPDP